MNSKKWATLLIMSLSTLMATINSSSLNAVLPYLTKILNLKFNESQMIVVVYLITLTSLLTICGRISDKIGHKRVFLTGTLIFGFSSILVLFSSKAIVIIVMRIIQAIGASFMVSSGPAILFSVFEKEKRGFAIGIHTTGISLGLILGPPIGGFILQHLSWQWLFLINIPISIISFTAILLIISEEPLNNRDNLRQDIFGMIMWAIAIPLILLSLPSIMKEESHKFLSITTLIVGMTIFFFFISYERKIVSPFFPIDLIKIPAYSGGLFSLLFGYTALFMSNFLIPFYLKIILDLEPHQTGLLMSTSSIAMFATTGISGYLSDRIGYYKPCIIGMILLSLGLMLMLFVEKTNAISFIIIAQIIIGSGLGIFNSPNTTAMLSIGGGQNTGITTGLLATMRNLGMSLGTVFSGIFTSLFSLILFRESAERINSINPDNFNTIFKLVISIAFVLSTVSIYLSSIRKGTDAPPNGQK